jgi:hypothetical protein
MLTDTIVVYGLILRPPYPTQNPVDNKFRVLNFLKADILSLFTLMKAFTALAPNCISLCRVTRKIVASIGTFKKFVLQGIILEKWWHHV